MYFDSHVRPCVRPKLFFENYQGLGCWERNSNLLGEATVVPNMLACQHRCQQTDGCRCTAFDRASKKCFEMIACEPTFCKSGPEFKNYTTSMLLNKKSSHLRDMRSILFPELAVETISGSAAEKTVSSTTFAAEKGIGADEGRLGFKPAARRFRQKGPAAHPAAQAVQAEVQSSASAVEPAACKMSPLLFKRCLRAGGCCAQSNCVFGDACGGKPSSSGPGR
jgi:hypothetical protein